MKGALSKECKDCERFKCSRQGCEELIQGKKNTEVAIRHYLYDNKPLLCVACQSLGVTAKDLNVYRCADCGVQKGRRNTMMNTSTISKTIDMLAVISFAWTVQKITASDGVQWSGS